MTNEEVFFSNPLPKNMKEGTLSKEELSKALEMTKAQKDKIIETIQGDELSNKLLALKVLVELNEAEDPTE